MARTVRITPETIASALHAQAAVVEQKVRTTINPDSGKALRAQWGDLQKQIRAVRNATHFTLDGDVLVAHY